MRPLHDQPTDFLGPGVRPLHDRPTDLPARLGRPWVGRVGALNAVVPLDADPLNNLKSTVEIG